jgi:hypothetical protein
MFSPLVKIYEKENKLIEIKAKVFYIHIQTKFHWCENRLQWYSNELTQSDMKVLEQVWGRLSTTESYCSSQKNYISQKVWVKNSDGIYILLDLNFTTISMSWHTVTHLLDICKSESCKQSLRNEECWNSFFVLFSLSKTHFHINNFKAYL